MNEYYYEVWYQWKTQKEPHFSYMGVVSAATANDAFILARGRITDHNGHPQIRNLRKI